MAFLSAAIGAGGSLLSGFLGQRGAKKAAKAQLAAQRESREAQIKAINEALVVNKDSYDKTGQIRTTGRTDADGIVRTAADSARSDLKAGFAGARERLQPLVAAGDNAFAYTGDATGVNGAEKQAAWFDTFKNRGEFKLAQDNAMQQAMQRYGSKLGSGAFFRAIDRTTATTAAGMVDQNLAQVRPLLQTGAQARSTLAGFSAQEGSDLARNDWMAGNAFLDNSRNYTSGSIGDLDTYTGNVMQGKLSIGNANSNYATNVGNINANKASQQANAWSSAISGAAGAFGNYFGSAGGGAQPTLSGWGATTKVA